MGDSTIDQMRDAVQPDNLTNTVRRRASLIGVVSGMRSTIPITLLTWSKKGEPEDPQSATAKRVITTMATVTELLLTRQAAKKSKGLSRGIIAGRIATGAIVGALLCRRHNHSIVEGVLLGAAGASAGAAIAYTIEEVLPEFTPIPGIILTWIEDSLAFWVGNQAINAETEVEPF